MVGRSLKVQMARFHAAGLLSASRHMRIRVVRHVVSVLSCVGLLTLIGLPSCRGHECDGGPVQEFGNLAGQGYWADADTWVSSENNSAEWLDYGPQRLYFFDPPGFTDFDQRKLTTATVYISPSRDPNQFGDNFTLAAGNSAIITYIQTVPSKIKGGIYVKNDTCAQYYMRAVFTVEPNPPAGPDAGTDGASDGASDAGTDAGGGDGSTDASSDAPAD
jgi:hypothetical protein